MATAHVSHSAAVLYACASALLEGSVHKWDSVDYRNSTVARAASSERHLRKQPAMPLWNSGPRVASAAPGSRPQVVIARCPFEPTMGLFHRIRLTTVRAGTVGLRRPFGARLQEISRRGSDGKF
jgi:hypothetical protein